jgi:Xaa-Pro aminopeptidase
LGHGLGLNIHEGPRLSSSASEEVLLQPGMVTTVEPGVYIPQWGGVRIEDLVLLVEDGIELLSHCPKQPAISLK